MSRNFFNKPSHIFIAEETEAVISYIKEQDCILNDTIEACPDLRELTGFAIYHYWADSESVNVFQVVGTAHPDYIGYSWIEMLRRGKRMPLNLRLLKENPDYYFSPEKKKPEMHYTKVNGKIYISGEGNHRTSIAKVLFFFTGDQVLHGIKFDEFLVDYEAKNLYEETKRTLLTEGYPVGIEVIRKNVRREDTAGWKKDYYEISFLLENYRYSRKKVVTKEGLKKLLQEVEERKSFWKRVFKGGKFLFSEILKK